LFLLAGSLYVYYIHLLTCRATVSKTEKESSGLSCLVQCFFKCFSIHTVRTEHFSLFQALNLSDVIRKYMVSNPLGWTFGGCLKINRRNCVCSLLLKPRTTGCDNPTLSVSFSAPNNQVTLEQHSYRFNMYIGCFCD